MKDDNGPCPTCMAQPPQMVSVPAAALENVLSMAAEALDIATPGEAESWRLLSDLFERATW